MNFWRFGVTVGATPGVTVDATLGATVWSAEALISGGIAGTTVDCALHPLDTFRTRLQSEKGFWASGGSEFDAVAGGFFAR